MKIIRCDGKAEIEFINQLKSRAAETNIKITQAVSEIIDDVRKNGDKAVLEYTIKFDGKAPECFEVSRVRSMMH